MKSIPKSPAPAPPINPSTPPVPISISDSQPLPPAILPPKSLLRDLLEGKLPPSVLRKL